ncbi:MAG TPA: hypothetical protein VH299_12815 [Solirubrobacterales bacterium]|jgi:hypothetical protein|nr:hypothetical protein [Solirubrobacterales bacterium]
MRKLIAVLVGVLLPAIVFVSVADAVPSTANIRIEGKEETLFEGRIPVSIEKIQASSDTQERDCDGVNALDPENTAPGITPTLASVEAMESIGETFDGQWYEGFDDYFIKRWGPDAQSPAEGSYWGILVNQTYTNIGGCQYQLDENDESLWIWDAFKQRPTLALFPEEAHYESGRRPTRAVAQVGQPFKVEVADYPDDGSEEVPCEEPSREGSSRYAGATVAPVEVNPKGFQRIKTSSTEAVATNAEGKASIVFAQPGIQRIKATVGAPGMETTVVRSNGLEVCVRENAGECEGFATPASSGAAGACSVTPPPSGGDEQATPVPPVAKLAPVEVGALKLTTPQVNRAHLADGKAVVSWKVLDAGPGIKKWTISSLTVGQKHARWLIRASGARKTSATIALPKGHTYKLRFAITDDNGKTSTLSLGKVKVPEARRRHRG